MPENSANPRSRRIRALRAGIEAATTFGDLGLAARLGSIHDAAVSEGKAHHCRDWPGEVPGDPAPDQASGPEACA